MYDMDKNVENTMEIIQVIIDKGGNYELAKSLIENNPSITKFSGEEIKKHIFLVMNHHIVYAVLFIVEDDLFWTVLNNNLCGILIKNNTSPIDYVILLMLESIDKYESLRHREEKQTLEMAINEYNLVKKNEESYHIK